MKHCGTQRLETERLILRRFVIEDSAAMYKNWASDEEVTRYLTWPAHSSPDISKSVIEDWVNSYSDENYYQWAVVLKDKGEPIGSITVVGMKEAVSMVHIGYCIGKAWWHSGITSEALKAVMDFLFDVVGVNRIEARHDPRNPNSGKVMKKCGMKYEGTLRSFDRNNQGICDACYYALLKSERKKLQVTCTDFAYTVNHCRQNLKEENLETMTSKKMYDLAVKKLETGKLEYLSISAICEDENEKNLVLYGDGTRFSVGIIDTMEESALCYDNGSGDSGITGLGGQDFPNTMITDDAVLLKDIIQCFCDKCEPLDRVRWVV